MEGQDLYAVRMEEIVNRFPNCLSVDLFVLNAANADGLKKNTW